MAEFDAYRQLVRRAAGCQGEGDRNDGVEYAPGCLAFPWNLLHHLSYCHDLRFAVLESGRLGLVPLVARPDDRYCVPPGVPVPMILMEEGSRRDDKSVYRRIVHSWIHGWGGHGGC